MQKSVIFLPDFIARPMNTAGNIQILHSIRPYQFDLLFLFSISEGNLGGGEKEEIDEYIAVVAGGGAAKRAEEKPNCSGLILLRIDLV